MAFLAVFLADTTESLATAPRRAREFADFPEAGPRAAASVSVFVEVVLEVLEFRDCDGGFSIPDVVVFFAGLLRPMAPFTAFELPRTLGFFNAADEGERSDGWVSGEFEFGAEIRKSSIEAPRFLSACLSHAGLGPRPLQVCPVLG